PSAMVDTEFLISRLCGPLNPTDRPAFRHAAESALADQGCLGDGLVYRTLVPLWRSYFHPPDDRRAMWDISNEHRGTNKLSNRPPIEYGGDLRPVRYRKRAE